MNNRIYGNLARTGGGITCVESQAVIYRNLILGNRADAAGGAAVECLLDRALITHNRIVGNVFTGSAWGSGGLTSVGLPGPRVENNLLAENRCSPGNTSSQGLSALGVQGGGEFYHNTVVRNWAPAAQAAVSLSGSGVAFVNNLVAFNTAGLLFETGVGPRRNCVFGHPNNDYRGNTTQWLEGGNLLADPRLVFNDLTVEVHLLPDSPCRDFGEEIALAGPAEDLDGETRRQGSGLDLGCDETDGQTTRFATRIVRVSPTGADTRTGDSWEQAKRTIQAAVWSLAPTGGEVWVAVGTYPEHLRVEPRVHIFGGFRGEESSRAERNPRAHASVVEGGQAGPVITLEYLDRFGSLDGLVVRNGRAVEGGGILCRLFAGTLRELIVRDNIAARGGGLAILGSSMPTVERCRFINNRAVHDPAEFPGEVGGQGGALFLNLSLAEVRNSLFVSNAATAETLANRPGLGGGPAGAGGAVYVGLPVCEASWGQSRGNFSELLLANNTLVHNLARATDGRLTQDHGGAVHFTQGCQVVNNLIAYNSSGVRSQRTTGFAIRHNCVFGNQPDWLTATDLTGSHGNFAADPLLLPAENYRLHPDSPCRDAGDTTVVLATWLDLQGERRVRGLEVDIGAVELPAEASRPNYFDEWQSHHFPGDQDPAIMGPAADPDGDGLPNLVEFAFGRNPRDPDMNFAPLQIQRPSNGSDDWGVEYRRPRGLVGLRYGLERSTGVTRWVPLSANITPILTPTTNGEWYVRYSGSRLGLITAGQGFFRLSVGIAD